MSPKYAVRLLAVLALAGGLTICGCDKKKSAQAGDVQEGDNYTLTITPPGAGKVGQPVAAVVQVLPKNGFKINLEYPTRLTATGPTGASPAKLSLSAKKAAALLEQELKFRPTFKVTTAGTHRFSGKLKFSVCTDELCYFHEPPIAWKSSVVD